MDENGATMKVCEGKCKGRLESRYSALVLFPLVLLLISFFLPSLLSFPTIFVRRLPSQVLGFLSTIDEGSRFVEETTTKQRSSKF